MAGRPLPDSRADALEWTFAAAFTLVGAVAWSALTLAELGLFSPVHVVALAAGVLLAAARLAGRDGVFRPRRPGIGAAVWALALLVGGWLVLAPPADPVVDGADDSMYLHVGALIAHRGTLAPTDRLLSVTPADQWPALFRTDRHWPPRLNRFAGGIQAAPGDATLEPNFFHLTPAWMAAVTTAAGPAAAPWATACLAWLTPLALFLAARRMAGNAAGVAASALLVINAGFGWAGRLPLSEVPAAFLIVSGVLFTSWWSASGSRMTALLAGAAFGLAALTRIDNLILVAPVAGVVIASRVRTSGGGGALAVHGGLTAQALVHAATISRPYSLRVLGYAMYDRRTAAAAAAVLALGAASALVLLVMRRVRIGLAARSGLSWVLVAAALAALALHAAGGGRHLVLLLTPAGVIAAGAGVVVLARRGGPAAWLVTGLVLVSALAYGHSAFDPAGVPWVLRRDMPVLLPLACLAIGAAWLPAGQSRRQRAAALLLVAALAAAWTLRARAQWPLRESFDARPGVAALAASVPSDAVVLVDLGVPSHLDLALDFDHDRTALAMDAAREHPQAFSGLAAHTIDAGRPLYLVTASSGIERPSAAGALEGFAFTTAGRFAVRTRRMAPRRTEWPDRVEDAETPLTLYRVTGSVDLPWLGDVGGDDLGLVGAGWLASETMLGAAARWTTEHAQLEVPRLRCAAGGPLAGSVRMASLRPPRVAQPRIEVRAGGQRLLSVVPADSTFHEYSFALPPDVARLSCASAVSWTIASGTFVPSRDAGLPDDRGLGVAVDRVEITAPR